MTRWELEHKKPTTKSKKAKHDMEKLDPSVARNEEKCKDGTLVPSLHAVSASILGKMMHTSEEIPQLQESLTKENLKLLKN